MTANQKKDRSVMALLWLLGYTDEGRLVPDDKWGESADAALKAYQEAEGLKVNGVLDGPTNQSLAGKRADDLAADASLTAKQCALILMDCVDDEFKADGAWGVHMQAASEAFVVKATSEAYYLEL